MRIDTIWKQRGSARLLVGDTGASYRTPQLIFKKANGRNATASSASDIDARSRQMNMDYALSHALQHHEGIKHFLVMYDVSCQYSKKVKRRFESSPQFLKWPSALIEWGIGKFHVHGHQRDCLVKYSPSFIPGAGLVDGEVIETLWAPLNRISGSTRAMSTSHRKEVIDDHMNDSNWRKTTGMGTSILFEVWKAKINDPMQ